MNGWQKMTEAERKKILKFVATHRWIFAKTYAAFCPHEYTLRRESNNEEFCEFVKLVWKYGFDARYGKNAGRYLVVDDGEGWYYFVFPADMDAGEQVKNSMTLINRANLQRWKFVEERDMFGSEIIVKTRKKGDEWGGKFEGISEG